MPSILTSAKLRLHRLPLRLISWIGVPVLLLEIGINLLCVDALGPGCWVFFDERATGIALFLNGLALFATLILSALATTVYALVKRKKTESHFSATRHLGIVLSLWSTPLLLSLLLRLEYCCMALRLFVLGFAPKDFLGVVFGLLPLLAAFGYTTVMFFKLVLARRILLAYFSAILGPLVHFLLIWFIGSLGLIQSTSTCGIKFVW